MLRARSAVQRFPVVEWRQRMEDFHKRSINTSRTMAGNNAWRPSDCEVQPTMQAVAVESEDWNPVYQAEPTQPDWDARSVNSDVSRMHTPNTPGQWSQTTLAPEQQYLAAPPRITVDEHGRRGSFSTDISDNDDYFTRSRAASIDTRNDGQGFDNFLTRVNRQIAKEQKHIPDPFLDAASAAPSRPFGGHSRVQSMESISSIVDEKASSPLNKAIASVSGLLR